MTEAARNHSTVPKLSAAALCLTIETLRVRRTIVLATKKLVMIIRRKLAESTSILGCSKDKILARGFGRSGPYKHRSFQNRLLGTIPRRESTPWPGTGALTHCLGHSSPGS